MCLNMGRFFSFLASSSGLLNLIKYIRLETYIIELLLLLSSLLLLLLLLLL